VTVDPDGDEYVYDQLATILREGIASGRYPSGRMLPSARSLSQEHGVSVGSVKKAIEVLKSEGLVRTVIGRGIFVTRA
jgi:GntR family transcriptional regulator